ncbi:MAG TPA: glutamine synthetase GlnII [Acidimicrobiales bacterium]|nr:glutamine synthetase GlnII [Acidimicrobiales bacterium]
MAIRAEYIWIDGSEPTAQLRSKTKILPGPTSLGELPIWGFDGSSTNQAPGKASDCVLQPVFSCPDPVRGGDDLLVLCEVLLTDMTPHRSNTRSALREVELQFRDQEPLFGIEQEYTLFRQDRPLGFPDGGFPGPQGPYYCSVGTGAAVGRPVAESHLDACLRAGLSLSGINAEVMPGQWEFQVGPLGPLDVADQLWVARWLLHRVAEDDDIAVSFDPKPAPGDWNGAGAHTNFSTASMRSDYQAVITAAEALGKNAEHHVLNYGEGIENRLTGSHETAPYDVFNYGVSDRGASVRIPWQVERDQGGYLEDRRPNANCDPYVVTRLILETCCGALA